MTQASDDELKALLEAASRPFAKGEKVKQLNEVESWLAAIGAKTGNYEFSATQLWLAYLKWSPKPIRQYKFYTQLRDALYQNRKVGKYITTYSLDPSSFDTSEEALRELNIQLRELNKLRYHAKKKNL